MGKSPEKAPLTNHRNPEAKPQGYQLEFGFPVTEYEHLLTPEALAFVAELHRRFAPNVDELLVAREKRQMLIDAGAQLTYPPETEWVRKSEWHVAPIVHDLEKRHVEITGPSSDAKMVINAFNSGANVFMADFEDAMSPTGRNVLNGQKFLYDAVRQRLTYDSPEGKHYALKDDIATLMVRPRGWHLREKHLIIDGKPAVAALVDFGLFFYNNAHELIDRGSGPYFYLPKMEQYHEARLWNDIFTFAQKELGIPYGTIRATALIETLLGALDAEEILYELRDHSAGLNPGRWDELFSINKVFRSYKNFLFPDRGQVTMEVPFMDAYVRRVIQVCHKHNAHAIGGMSAFIPVRRDPEANEKAFLQVRADKLRELDRGHDGTWVAHPDLVSEARKVFDTLGAPHQIDKKREESIEALDLLEMEIPIGTITEKGLRHNIAVGLRYVAAWLAGSGAVPIYNLMEDAATAEICRTQLWQWLHHGATLDDGRAVNSEMFTKLFIDECKKADIELPHLKPELTLAAKLFHDWMEEDGCRDFLTTHAYDFLP